MRLDLAYDGTAFSGWASQPGLRTVQGTLEAGLGTILRLPQVGLTVAGRTDAGVHARGQVCHADLPDARVASCLPPELTRRLGRLLPEDLRVRLAVVAAPGFDARFSALWRRYSYVLCDDMTRLDPLDRWRVVTWARPLDAEAMNAAAATLIGEHDFASFCRRRKGATTIRCLHELVLVRDGETGLLAARVVADAFCHSMVRSLMGCLVAVGDGRRSVGWPAEVLHGRTRNPGVTVMPPRGLTLEQVHYPPDDELDARALQTRARRALP